MIEISEKQVSVIARDCLVPAYLTIGGIQQEFRVTQVDSSFSGYGGSKFMAELEKVPMSEILVPRKVEEKVSTKQDKYTIKHIELKVGDYLLREDFSESQWDYLLLNWKPNVEWYSSKEEAMTYFNIIRVFDSYEGVRIGSSNGNEVRASNRRITPDMLLWTPIYNPENIVVTWGDVALDFSDLVFIPQPKKEKSELKYTELWMADTSNDMLDTTMGYLTNGKVYEILSSSFIQGRQQFEVICDNGYVYYFHNGWFKPVRLYDEDESELICRDIEFVEGDYIDLRKHTPEQIRHIAKFYKFFNVEQLLESNLWSRVYWNEQDGFTGTLRDTYVLNKEYTYDDIFYSEEI